MPARRHTAPSKFVLTRAPDADTQPHPLSPRSACAVVACIWWRIGWAVAEHGQYGWQFTATTVPILLQDNFCPVAVQNFSRAERPHLDFACASAELAGEPLFDLDALLIAYDTQVGTPHTAERRQPDPRDRPHHPRPRYP